MDDATIEKLTRALDELEKTHLKFAEQLEAARATLSQHPTTGQHVKHLFEVFAEWWQGRYNDKYHFAGARDAGSFKRLLKTMDVETVAARMRLYLLDDDRFLVSQRHPLNLFISKINQYGTRPITEPPPRAVGCSHTPACTSDVDCTRRRAAERRAVR